MPILLPRPITSWGLLYLLFRGGGGFVGQCRLGADNDNDNNNSHNNLIGDEDIEYASDPSAQHNNQPYEWGNEEMATNKEEDDNVCWRMTAEGREGEAMMTT